MSSINAEVGLLIDRDVPRALQPEEVRGGLEGEPYAMKTVLGWFKSDTDLEIQRYAV